MRRLWRWLTTDQHVTTLSGIGRIAVTYRRSSGRICAVTVMPHGHPATFVDVGPIDLDKPSRPRSPRHPRRQDMTAHDKITDWELEDISDPPGTPRFDEDGPAFGPIGAPPGAVAAEGCRHDMIAEAAGLRVCLDCGTPNPKRRRQRRTLAGHPTAAEVSWLQAASTPDDLRLRARRLLLDRQTRQAIRDFAGH